MAPSGGARKSMAIAMLFCDMGVSFTRRDEVRSLHGFYFKFTILLEMVIKGEGGFNLEALHQGKTSAISETEFLVGKALKYVPCLSENLFCQVSDFDQTRCLDHLAKLNGYFMTGPQSYNCVAFI